MLGFLFALINQLRLGGFEGPGPIAQVRCQCSKGRHFSYFSPKLAVFYS